MGQARRRRRSEGMFSIHRSFRLNAKQLRTLQMYTDKFDLLNEGEALRHMIDNYMEPELEAALAAEAAGQPVKAPKTSLQISPPAPERLPAVTESAPKKRWLAKPAIDTVDTDGVTSDDGMRPPIVSSRGPAITRVLAEEEDTSSRSRVARYEPDQDRYGSIKDD